MKRILSVFLTMILLVLRGAFGTPDVPENSIAVIEKTVCEAEGEYSGKTVILHTNDVHGAVEGYSYIAALRDSVEGEGGTVILVDDGDFTNGNCYVSYYNGTSAVELMNAVGYDVAALGNHEFDFGIDTLLSNLEEADFRTICSNVYRDGETLIDSEVIVNVGDVDIGFFGLLSSETQTKTNPSLIKGLTFTENEVMYEAAQKETDLLGDECDIIICLAHLGTDMSSAGNRSIDVADNVEGIDFIIDGHSHTVLDSEENGVKIQSTGTGFENIGMIVIDNDTKRIESNRLIPTEGLEQDEAVLTLAKEIIEEVDAQYGEQFAETKVNLDGEKPHVRSLETNLGDLICDSLIWNVSNTEELEVDAEHIIAVTNGGGIRNSIPAGGITRNDIFSVLPFGNTIVVNYITGAELLEALEASTFSTPETIGGFPQISGMKIQIDTTKEYDAGEEYPDSTYSSPKSINRVTILEVNGKPFNPDDIYAVVTNDFCAAGGDTYYAFRRAFEEGKGFDTSMPLDEGLVFYIQEYLNGEIPADYAEPQGRISVIG